MTGFGKAIADHGVEETQERGVKDIHVQIFNIFIPYDLA